MRVTPASPERKEARPLPPPVRGWKGPGPVAVESGGRTDWRVRRHVSGGHVLQFAGLAGQPAPLAASLGGLCPGGSLRLAGGCGLAGGLATGRARTLLDRGGGRDRGLGGEQRVEVGADDRLDALGNG